MKIFKMKHIAVVLIAGLLGSCTATDNLPEVDENAAMEKGEFVVERNMHYFVDGLSTIDEELIKKSLSNAWNTHYDYTKNKVVISSTYEKYEKYKKTDIQFTERLHINNVDLDTKSSASISQSVIAAPYIYNKYDHIKYNNHLVFYVVDENSKQITIFHASKRNSFGSGFNAHYINQFGTATFSTYNIVGGSMFNNDLSPKTYLRNTGHTAKSITFYRYNDYTGSNVVISFPKNSQKIITARKVTIGGLLAKSYQ